MTTEATATEFPWPSASPYDFTIRAMAGPEPVFDPVVREFLRNTTAEFQARYRPGGLLDWASLGGEAPWLHRLTFRTLGLARAADGTVRIIERHTVALRFLPDYLRHVHRFETLALIEPASAFHPNLSYPAICLEIHPGESLLDIALSLHDLIRWRLVQLNEHDALNAAACAYGRAHLHDFPLDKRPLFGRKLALEVTAAEDKS